MTMEHRDLVCAKCQRQVSVTRTGFLVDQIQESGYQPLILPAVGLSCWLCPLCADELGGLLAEAVTWLAPLPEDIAGLPWWTLRRLARRVQGRPSGPG